MQNGNYYYVGIFCHYLKLQVQLKSKNFKIIYFVINIEENFMKRKIFKNEIIFKNFFVLNQAKKLLK